MNVLPVLHAMYGAALLLVPGPLLRGIGDPAGRRARLVTRVLGTRHLGQAALLAMFGRRAARLGAAVDGLHGASMLVLALAGQRHRRAAAVSGVVAGALAALELRQGSDG